PTAEARDVTSTLTIEPFLRALVECGGSDLHCKVGSPPRVRIDGRLRKLQTRDLTAADTETMVREVLRADLVEEFDRSTDDDFSTALRAAMRQDPDVILVGEMRDMETVKAALAASETGHFVMSTLHTTDAQETINRVIDFFPPHEQKQVRLSLAGALRGIICQRLVPRADGEGRCVAMEVCINTGRVADAIAEPDKTSTMMSLIGEGAYYGMQTFDQHLVGLIRDGVITLDAAMAASTNPHDLTVELRRLGLVA